MKDKNSCTWQHITTSLRKLTGNGNMTLSFYRQPEIETKTITRHSGVVSDFIDKGHKRLLSKQKTMINNLFLGQGSCSLLYINHQRDGNENQLITLLSLEITSFRSMNKWPITRISNRKCLPHTAVFVLVGADWFSHEHDFWSLLIRTHVIFKVRGNSHNLK